MVILHKLVNLISRLAFTIPFTFSEIMKALVLVEHLSRLVFKVFINTN